MSLRTWIAPARTALVIVDMQVDFASPKGLAAQWGMDLSAVPPALAAAERLAATARASAVPVIFAGLFTTPQSDSEMWNERARRRGHESGESLAFCRADSSGSHFFGPQPLEGELILRKTRYSPFWDTDIDVRLKAMGVDTLVLAGLTTECCIDSTARDAFNHDFHVFVPVDACAAYEADLHAASLRVMDLNTAILTDTDSVVAAWGSNPLN